jgi:hypothetical protein
VNHRRRILSTAPGHPARWNDKTVILVCTKASISVMSRFLCWREILKESFLPLSTRRLVVGREWIFVAVDSASNEDLYWPAGDPLVGGGARHGSSDVVYAADSKTDEQASIQTPARQSLQYPMGKKPSCLASTEVARKIVTWLIALLMATIRMIRHMMRRRGTSWKQRWRRCG